jgi:hypothetical protein
MRRDALFFRKKSPEPQNESLTLEYPLAIDMIQSGVSLAEMKSALKMRGVVQEKRFMGVEFRVLIDMDYNKKRISFKLTYDPSVYSEKEILRVAQEFSKRIYRESGHQGMRKKASSTQGIIRDLLMEGASDRRILVTLVDQMNITPSEAKRVLHRYK